MSRARWSLAALAAAALIGAGCSGGTAENDDAGTGGSSGSGTSAGAKAAGPQGKGVTFAKCMRDSGVREFPDPDASGELTIDAVVNGSSLDTESAAWKQAIAACKDLQPPGFTGTKRSDGQQKAALEFARCMRHNGVEDFPDPEPGGPMIDTRRIPSLAGKDPRTVLAEPMQKCGDRAERAGATGP